MVQHRIENIRGSENIVRRSTRSIASARNSAFLRHPIHAWYAAANEHLCRWYARLSTQARMRSCGQGTTEYAIIVGVIVVIAIVAIVGFKPKIQALWDAISNGLGSL